jgi:predicted SnoaL-like aldol condensation-catalyzing enzyme
MKSASCGIAILGLLGASAVLAAPAWAAPSEEANKQLVGDFYADVFARHNFDAACKYLSADYTQHSTDYRDPAANMKIHGCAEFAREFSKGWSAATPEQREAAHTKVLGMVAEENRVVIYTQFSGLKKDGTRVTGTEFDMFEIADGKIVGHWSPEAPTPIAG